MLSSQQIKENLGRYAAKYAEQNIYIGLGTGTTIYWLLKELGERVRQGLNITAVATSVQTQNILEAENIKYVSLNEVNALSLTIDGADEVDTNGNLIKGGGGALLQEKMVAAASEKLIVIADESKFVDNLGKFALPVEVIPFGWKQVQKKITGEYKVECVLRQKNNEVFVTDHNNYILDCTFNPIKNPEELNMQLHLIPGVVETGLFVHMAKTAIKGFADGSIKEYNF